MGRGLPEDALKAFVVILRYASGFSGISTSEKEQCHFPHWRCLQIHAQANMLEKLLAGRGNHSVFIKNFLKIKRNFTFYFSLANSSLQQWWAKGKDKEIMELSIS